MTGFEPATLRSTISKSGETPLISQCFQALLCPVTSGCVANGVADFLPAEQAEHRLASALFLNCSESPNSCLVGRHHESFCFIVSVS